MCFPSLSPSWAQFFLVKLFWAAPHARKPCDRHTDGSLSPLHPNHHLQKSWNEFHLQLIRQSCPPWAQLTARRNYLHTGEHSWRTKHGSALASSGLLWSQLLSNVPQLLVYSQQLLCYQNLTTSPTNWSDANVMFAFQMLPASQDSWAVWSALTACACCPASFHNSFSAGD